MDQEAGHNGDEAREPETSVMAIGSMVAGILGLSLLPAIGSFIALGLGYAALRDVRRSEWLKGERLARMGVILGWLGVAVAIVGVCLVFWAILLGFTAIPGFTVCGGVSVGS